MPHKQAHKSCMQAQWVHLQYGLHILIVDLKYDTCSYTILWVHSYIANLKFVSKNRANVEYSLNGLASWNGDTAGSLMEMSAMTCWFILQKFGPCTYLNLLVCLV